MNIHGSEDELSAEHFSNERESESLLTLGIDQNNNNYTSSPPIISRKNTPDSSQQQQQQQQQHKNVPNTSNIDGAASTSSFEPKLLSDESKLNDAISAAEETKVGTDRRRRRRIEGDSGFKEPFCSTPTDSPNVARKHLMKSSASSTSSTSSKSSKSVSDSDSDTTSNSHDETSSFLVDSKVAKHRRRHKHSNTTKRNAASSSSAAAAAHKANSSALADTLEKESLVQQPQPQPQAKPQPQHRRRRRNNSIRRRRQSDIDIETIGNTSASQHRDFSHRRPSHSERSLLMNKGFAQEFMIDLEDSDYARRQQQAARTLSKSSTSDLSDTDHHDGLISHASSINDGIPDVCMPLDSTSPNLLLNSNSIREESFKQHRYGDGHDDDDEDDEEYGSGFPRSRSEPDFSVLDDFLRQEKHKSQARMANFPSKRFQEPMRINGRLRAANESYKGKEFERPYRFTFFAEGISSTIHSPTLWEIIQDENQTFAELFGVSTLATTSSNTPSRAQSESDSASDNNSATKNEFLDTGPKPIKTKLRKSSRNRRMSSRIWWLDVKDPTDNEMNILSRAFGIHPLTTEDISTEEAREKVELFRHYYLVSFRSFDHVLQNGEFEPQSIYIVVFRRGVITFHFGATPHCATVRRRIRQLTGYITLSPDWIAYAIIDDITDTFQPIIDRIEKDVDVIDTLVLSMEFNEDIRHKKLGAEQSQMLRRIGECRKQVMSLLRLLGTKADVIRGFSKRCNEKLGMSPQTDIGLYLGDIQDHVVTMVQNLNFYEKILSRSHSNYLAKISIEMTKVNNNTNDVVSRLTILGTIIFPMNLISGLWGMNVPVPGQSSDGLGWFFSICFALASFAFLSVSLCRWFHVI